MEIALLLVAVVLVVIVVSRATAPVGLPAPLALLLAGGVLSFVPHVPVPRLSSEVVLLGLLPPLLYAAALSTSLIDIRTFRAKILSLSVGLVLFTALGVGGSTSLLENLQSAIGVDDLDVTTDEKGGTAVSAGKYLNDRTYVTIQKGDKPGSGKATIDLNVGRGVKLRGVGTWPLKSTFYAYLARLPKADGATLVYPDGYCHFGNFLDETYYKQITAEHLSDEVVRGRKVQRWVAPNHADNHFLDARVYNMAMADAYLATWTPDDWSRRASERGVPKDLMTPDLFNQLRPKIETSKPEAAKNDPFAKLTALNQGVH